MPDQSITCPGCTCLCDDIQLASETDVNARSFGKACERGAAWFTDGLKHADRPVEHRIAGLPCTLETAVATACNEIKRATAPLICGLENLTVDAQQEAWKLADAARATLDTSLHTRNRASMYSLQKHGKVTATLGEISTRGDLIVFWFCDPAQTHPRLMEHLAVQNKRVIVVDESRTTTATMAHQFIQIPADQAPRTLKLLNGLLHKHPLSQSNFRTAIPTWAQPLADELRNSKYGSICYGHTTDESEFDLAADETASLVRTLNQHTRFVSLSLRNDGNAMGAENVIAWSSGYPFAVSYSTGAPRFNRNEYAAATILERVECDLVLVGPIDARQIERLPVPANRHLQQSATIELSTSGRSLTNAKVLIHVAQPGIDDVGDFCRMDNVSIPLARIIVSDRPAAAEVLSAILTGL